jgi:hypothetical protein
VQQCYSVHQDLTEFRGLDLLCRCCILCTTSPPQSVYVTYSTTVWVCSRFYWHPNVLLKILCGALSTSLILLQSRTICASLDCPLADSQWHAACCPHQGVPLIPVTFVGGTVVGSILPLHSSASTSHGIGHMSLSSSCSLLSVAGSQPSIAASWHIPADCLKCLLPFSELSHASRQGLLEGTSVLVCFSLDYVRWKIVLLETLDTVGCLSFWVLESKGPCQGRVVSTQGEFLSIAGFVEVFHCLHSSQ